jgi:hypothetical protein
MIGLEERNLLIEEQENRIRRLEGNESIFKGKIGRSTLCLGFLWFTLCYNDFASVIIIPFVLYERKMNLATFLVGFLGEIPSILMSLFLVDKEGIGRKGAIVGYGFILFFLNLLVYIQHFDNLSVNLFV